MNSIVSAIEDMIDELEDLAYNQKTDLLNAKRNEISFAIKKLLCGEDESDENVNSPAHYKLDGLDIESKEVINAVLGAKGYIHWACGNAMKYLLNIGEKLRR